MEDDSEPPSKHKLRAGTKRIAFVYNIRHKYPNPKKPDTFLEADYDDKETIDLIIKHLRRNFVVYPVEANEEAYLTLYKIKDKIDLVLNYSEGLHGKDKYSHVPAMLEMLGIPYTGSGPLTQALIMNKDKTKELFVSNGIPTAKFQVFNNSNENLKKGLSFPLLVKPVNFGSSAGITNESIVRNGKELKKRIGFISKVFKSRVMVEEFLEGREFSISLLGNPPKILPIIEVDHSKLPKKYLPIQSLEVKWYFEEEENADYLVCPANISPKLRRKLEEIAKRVWIVLGIYDFCRIDIRCDKKGEPYVLEVNSPMGVMPPEVSKTSCFPLAARAKGINYDALLKIMINTSIKRNKKGGKYKKY